MARSTSRTGTATRGALLALALLVLLAVTVAACGGGSDFEGTWVKEGDTGQMVITKGDDGYDVKISVGTDANAAVTLTAKEDGDKLILSDPTGESKDTIEMTVSGDTLTMKSGDQTETLTRK
jgi:hypothetical protein